MRKPVLVLSCEHAVNTVPNEYTAYFLEHEGLLYTHRGIDFGALDIATHLSDYFNCDLIQAKATRLLIDCNRRLANPYCFSEITAPLPIETKKQIIRDFYSPFREEVKTLISTYVKCGYQVWHFSVHSFTPVLNGLIRNADIGFLYDPARSNEKVLAKKMAVRIKESV